VSKSAFGHFPLVLFRYRNVTSSVPLQKQNEFELLIQGASPSENRPPWGQNKAPKGLRGRIAHRVGQRGNTVLTEAELRQARLCPRQPHSADHGR
jgi:hypothetical protein